MSKVIDTISATTTGGRNGHGESSDGKLHVQFSLAKALGGKGDGVTPEHLFAQGYTACFGSALQYVAGLKKIDIGTDFSVTAKVDLLQGDDGFSLAVELIAKVPKVDKTVAEELVKTAHTVCPYSKATKGNIPVKLSVA
jgi:Ohr subfamily peroxiredoxin